MRQVFVLALLVSLAGPAAAQMSAACTEDLVTVDQSFDETLARLDSVTAASDREKCAAYDHHVAVMLSAREIFLRCLSGHDRSENVGQLEVSIGDFRAVIDRKCPKQ
jgi:hypothetical protein